MLVLDSKAMSQSIIPHYSTLLSIVPVYYTTNNYYPKVSTILMLGYFVERRTVGAF